MMVGDTQLAKLTKLLVKCLERGTVRLGPEQVVASRASLDRFLILLRKRFSSLDAALASVAEDEYARKKHEHKHCYSC